MKENEIRIKIKRSASVIINFLLNPANTPKWIPSILEEKTNEWPFKVGTIYRNRNKDGVWTEYELIELEKNKSFTMKQKNSFYHVRYRFIPLEDGSTEVIYLEWVEKGQLKDPFSRSMLDNLKTAVENI